MLSLPFLYERSHVAFTFNCRAQGAFDGIPPALLDGMVSCRRAQHENVDSHTVLAGVDFSAQDFNALRSKRAGDIGKKPVTSAATTCQLSDSPPALHPLSPQCVYFKTFPPI